MDTSGFGGFGPFLEFLNAARGVHKLLFASVKRVAIRTDFHVDFGKRAPSGECVAAGANYLGSRVIGWMDVFFHRIRKIITGGRSFDKARIWGIYGNLLQFWHRHIFV